MTCASRKSDDAILIHNALFVCLFTFVSITSVKDRSRYNVCKASHKIVTFYFIFISVAPQKKDEKKYIHFIFFVISPPKVKAGPATIVRTIGNRDWKVGTRGRGEWGGGEGTGDGEVRLDEDKDVAADWLDFF